ncbi:hypothetical protein [Mucilaginibacter lacusdianchii]|uniref:hypothetical protein n=1 Tax=Mucilaginibacter lacusdianchii TaxID=2684211 RepID=UPI00131ECA18|nr:hypothetical protein [Mucilaginibacter sp. JXJ CY 39]
MKLWKKLLLYSVSLTGVWLTCLVIVLACGGEVDPYDYYTSFFHPDVQGKANYSAFYFTDYQFTYTDAEPVSEASVNAAEWANYLGNTVKPRDVEKIMYGLDSAGKERAVHFFEQDPPVADSLAANKFLWALKDPAHAAARKYYQFAQQAEYLGQSSYNYWEPAPLDTAGLKATADTAQQAALHESDNFLKLRYLYQAQKLNHYAENYAQAKDIYDQHIAKIPLKSHVKGWALALKAGEERRLGDTTHAAYLFAKVFADYPERRLQAYRNYHYIAAPFTDVLKLAQTPEEKANLYAIKSFANPEIETDALEQVYANAPSSSLVGVLLVREINKLEQYYVTPALANNTDEAYSSRSGQPVLQQSAPTVAKWPLIVGILIFVAGITVLVLAIKKSNEKPIGKIAGGILVVAGILGITWFAVSYLKNKPSNNAQSLTQGSFFINVPDSIKAKYDAHIEKLKNFCTTLNSDGKYAEPQIGTIANAYLCFMQNKSDDGLASLRKLDNQSLNSNLADQKQIIKLLLSAQRLKQVKEVDETALLPSLQWLHGKANQASKHKTNEYPEKPENYNRFAITERNFYTYVMAPAYLRQGDTARAALAMLKAGNNDPLSYSGYIDERIPDFWFNFLHSNHLKQIINWKEHPQTNSYLSFLSSDLKTVSNDKIYELLGTIALREHHYPEAAVAFQRIKDKKIKNALYNGEDYYSNGESYQGDPFSVGINDYPKHFSGKRYTKSTFAQKMAELESKMKSDPKNADLFYQMANGIYNTSTYGNSWGLIAYKWSSYDFGRKPLYYYDGDYINTTLAKQYYLKARDLSNNQEFKAKCTFMAAKCEQKKYEAPSFINYDTYDKREKEYLAALKQNKYFKEMTQYKPTAFYKQAVGECSYLRDYIDGK